MIELLFEARQLLASFRRCCSQQALCATLKLPLLSAVLPFNKIFSPHCLQNFDVHLFQCTSSSTPMATDRLCKGPRLNARAHVGACKP